MLEVGFDAHLIGFFRPTTATKTRLSQLLENPTSAARHHCPLLFFMLLQYSQLNVPLLTRAAVEDLLSVLCGLENGGSGEYMCGEIPACRA